MGCCASKDSETLGRKRKSLLSKGKGSKKQLGSMAGSASTFTPADHTIIVDSSTTDALDHAYPAAGYSEAKSEPVDTSSRRKTRLHAIAKFNLSPTEGIAFLVESGIVSRTPESVAQFLHAPRPHSHHRGARSGLNKRHVGEYMGQRGKSDHERIFFSHLRDEYAKLCNFMDRRLDKALRTWLQGFRMPADSGMVDRLLKSFARAYHRENPKMFRDTDVGFVLSFATIMLNADLHTRGVSSTMDMDAFVAMNKGINMGEDLPKPLLTSIFKGIQKRPLKIQSSSDVVTFFSPTREGWLHKRGMAESSEWVKRYFMLNSSNLYYFFSPEHVEETKPRCIFTLENAAVEAEGPDRIKISSTSGFIRSVKRRKGGQLEQGRHKSFFLKATTTSQRDEWLNALETEVIRGPFFRTVDEKRRRLRMGKKKQKRRSATSRASPRRPRKEISTDRDSSADERSSVDGSEGLLAADADFEAMSYITRAESEAEFGTVPRSGEELDAAAHAMLDILSPPRPPFGSFASQSSIPALEASSVPALVLMDPKKGKATYAESLAGIRRAGTGSTVPV